MSTPPRKYGSTLGWALCVAAGSLGWTFASLGAYAVVENAPAIPTLVSLAVGGVFLALSVVVWREETKK